MEEENTKYMSKKEYLKKYDSNVGYALYVQDKIKSGDYARLETGDIYKVIGVGKDKRIYYIWGEHDWFDCSAVTNLSNKIDEIVEVGDLIIYRLKGLKHQFKGFLRLYKDVRSGKENLGIDNYSLEQIEIVKILTHEKIELNCYEVGE